MYSLPIINSLRVPVIIVILWRYFAIPFFVLHVNFSLLLHNKLHLIVLSITMYNYAYTIKWDIFMCSKFLLISREASCLV